MKYYIITRTIIEQSGAHKIEAVTLATTSEAVLDREIATLNKNKRTHFFTAEKVFGCHKTGLTECIMYYFSLANNSKNYQLITATKNTCIAMFKRVHCISEKQAIEMLKLRDYMIAGTSL